MANSSGAFKKKKVYFSQVSNIALRDNELSLKAKGLYALIQSYVTIEDFVLYKNNLKSQCSEGEKAFENTWKELKDKGYLIQYRFQDENTKQFFYEYELLDEKNVEMANKIHDAQNRKKQEEKIHNPPKVGMDNGEKSIPTISEGMANGYDGKVGGYNNTDPSHTYIEEEEALRQIYKSYSLVKNTKLSDYDRKRLLELVKIHGEANTLKAIKMMAEMAEKPNLKYLKSTLEDWKSKGLDTIEKIELHFAKEEVLKEDARNNRRKQLEKAAKGNIKIKMDSFNSYAQRDYGGNLDKVIEDMAKDNVEEKEDIIEPITDTKEWLQKKRNKK